MTLNEWIDTLAADLAAVDAAVDKAKATLKASSEVSIPLSQPKAEQRQRRTRADPSAMFGIFWEAYPRKTGKETARKTWVKMGCDEICGIVGAGLALQREAGYQLCPATVGIEHIPYASTWLEGKRWEDKPEKREPPRDGQPQNFDGMDYGVSS